MVSTSPRLTIRKKTIEVPFFREQLNKEVSLEMMQIPAGVFVMGSPKEELERQNRESPQHVVEVPSFFMGKYPITQSQWQAVVIATTSDLNPTPSYFKEDFEKSGDRWQRPVEQVSWHNAVKFCEALSHLTQRPYRLPSEAEWEYACRAIQLPSTSLLLSQEQVDEKAMIEEWNREYHQPFHFGETITTKLANYRGTDNEEYGWQGSYGRGVQGGYRGETTPVEYFEVANAFGLCDMHGNVWEWCQDDYHGSYKSAPADGSAWVSDEDTTKILRGGSWSNIPRGCRSAYRLDFDPGLRDADIGFRVVCPLRGR